MSWRVATILSLCLSACGAPALELQAPSAGRLELHGERPLTEVGPWFDPAWSPDGARLSVAGLRYRGLHTISAQGGALVAVPGSLEHNAFRHRWLEGGERILCPQRGRHAAVSFQLPGGEPSLLAADHIHSAPVFVQDDDVWLRRPEAAPLRLTQGSDRFFDPQLSPDGALLAVVGLASGLHVVDVDSGLALFRAPGGSHPSWSPDGLWLLFERANDDGHTLSDAEIWALSITDGDQLRVTDSPDTVDLHPAVSPDGTQLAWVRDGALMVAELWREVPR